MSAGKRSGPLQPEGFEVTAVKQEIYETVKVAAEQKVRLRIKR